MRTKNLFVMCSAYWLTFLPVTLITVLRTTVTNPVQFVITWIYVSSSAVNGFLYIALHSSVRHELRRYLPRCRRFSVAPASTRVVDVGVQLHMGLVNTGTGVHGVSQAPAPVMTSSPRRLTEQLPTAVL